jgi:hypothetical protein
MKKFAITYATATSLMSNEAARNASSLVRAAYDAMQASTNGEQCSACAKKRKTNEAANSLVSSLQSASDMELDRLKAALGVDKLVFSSGFTFIER